MLIKDYSIALESVRASKKLTHYLGFSAIIHGISNSLWDYSTLTLLGKMYFKVVFRQYILPPGLFNGTMDGVSTGHHAFSSRLRKGDGGVCVGGFSKIADGAAKKMIYPIKPRFLRWGFMARQIFFIFNSLSCKSR